MIKKIRGIQMRAINFDYAVRGDQKEVVYTKSFDEMTVDTDNGSWVVDRADLVSYLNKRNKQYEKDRKEKRNQI